MTHSMSKENSYEDPFYQQKRALTEDANRRAVRLSVFRAIEQPEAEQAQALTTAFEAYQQHAHFLIPQSVEHWAKRIGDDPEVARKEMLERFFKKDVNVAKKIKASGLLIKGQELNLAELIKTEETEINRLQKITASL